MKRVHLFADESGNFDFTNGGTRYFILTTITLPDFSLGDGLLRLRRDMGWKGIPLSDAFHATTDAQAVRDEVYASIVRYDFRVDATILDKRNAYPHLQQDEVRFYRTAWYLHMKYVVPRITSQGDELFVIGASLGTKKKRNLFGAAIDDVANQTAAGRVYKTAAWSADCEPCLQAADYCCWAIQRKWEGSDPRSYVLIANKIWSEFQAF